jgi:hypothetical protein
MRNILLTLTSLLLGIFSLSAQEMNWDPALQQIRVDVAYLSSDLLEGRETGSAGEKLASEYIASRFADAGLIPSGTDESWFQPFTFKLPANPHDTESKGKAYTGRNVVGFLDAGSELTVVIGAHYDHLGYGGSGSGSLSKSDSAIHNGADDNASGISAMLYIAEVLQEAISGQVDEGALPNVLFIAFSGEEQGLGGSKAFVNQPDQSLAAVNYMINMDMVGRLNADKVLAVNGVGTSPVWKEVLDLLSGEGFQFKTSESGIGPSDHTSFYLKDIPVLHFFTGQHGDYHKPSDDAEKVNFEGVKEVGDLIIKLIRQLPANERLEFSKTKDEDESRKAAAFKVTLGVMPDYMFDGDGMRIDAVLDDRPGMKAGLEDGDVVISIGGTVVMDIYSYMEALAFYKVGDKAKVVVRRGEKEMEFEVTF